YCNRGSPFELLRRHARPLEVCLARGRAFLCRLVCPVSRRQIGLKVSRYYRNSFSGFGPGGISPVVKTLIIICSTTFLLQIFDGIAGGATFTSKFGLVPYLVTHRLYLWQLLTYIFLHGGFLHILFNMLGLWMFGTDLELISSSQA